MKKKLAIIGASTGQLPLCLKARQMGLETFCFAWPEGAVCRDHVDHFLPISIFDIDDIVEACRLNGVGGVISNASEATAYAAACIAEKLGLPGTPSACLLKIQDKVHTRIITNSIEGLSPVGFCKADVNELLKTFPRPFVMKPVSGSAKKGVNYVDDDFTADSLTEDEREMEFFAEAFAEGDEYSVESISFRGSHDVIQITRKIGTGAPHFVELEHHQPAGLPEETEDKVRKVIPEILTALGYTDGASHTEIKINTRGEIYLIEVNPRGGGDFISSDLVGLSTDFDYLGGMIEAALGEYVSVPVRNVAYAGVYFLSAFTERLLPHFTGAAQPWLVRRTKDDDQLRFSTSNHDRNGHIIYCAKEKVTL